MRRFFGARPALLWIILAVVAVAAVAGVAIAAGGGGGGEGSEETMSLRVPIASSEDDAEEKDSGLVRLTSGSLELVTDDSVQVVGLRFTGVEVPPGARITQARIEFTVDEPSAETTALSIGAQAKPAPAAFVEVDDDISSRPLFESVVKWTPSGWGASGTTAVTPSLARLVQAAIDQPGWEAGQPLVFVVSGTGRRVATSFDGEPSDAPALLVDFLPPAGNPPAVEITAPVDGSTVAGDIEAAATATDPEDGDLSDRIQWSSDRDGDLGDGGQLTASLRPGPHTITASVKDSDGIASSDTIDVEVTTETPRLLTAGDIGLCGEGADEQTASLIQASPEATVIALGDLAYSDGTEEEFANCYDTSWGAFRDRTFAVPGNHEYHSFGAEPFFDYWDGAAFDREQPWYSFDIGQWHIVGLDTNCIEIGGCSRTSEQALWLAEDLAANRRPCTLAFSHQPRYSSGSHGSNDELAELWQLMLDFNVDLMLSGHDHGYERFAPQDAEGDAADDGIRQIVVGTGGASLRPYDELEPNSEIADASSHGVLQLLLHDTSYEWEFLPIERGTLRDSGSAECNADAPDGLPPEVTISAPAAATEVVEGDPVELSAEAGDLSDSILWSSDTDGDLGRGPSITVTDLSSGRHRIVAAVERDGMIGADAIEVEVRPPGPILTTVEARPADDADDAEESADGEVSLNENRIDVGDDRIAAFRFPEVEIPKGAEIARAWVQFHAADDADDEADMEVRAELTPDAAPFTDESGDISSRRFTDASVRWRTPPWEAKNDAGDRQRTPDLTTLLDEVLRQPDWQSGGAIVMQIRGSGTRPVRSFGSTATALPVLHVEFTTGG